MWCKAPWKASAGAAQAIALLYFQAFRDGPYLTYPTNPTLLQSFNPRIATYHCGADSHKFARPQREQRVWHGRRASKEGTHFQPQNTLGIEGAWLR
jgi:hypothetical protein